MTEPITAAERAQWQAACEAATPGPWRLTWDSQELRLHQAGAWEPAIAEWGYAVSPWRPETYDEVDRRDADFMVIAREALPRLLAALTAAEAERDAAQAAYMDLRIKLYRLLSEMVPRFAEILSGIETYDNATWGASGSGRGGWVAVSDAPQQATFSTGGC